jgi:hypothetical protein
VKSTTSEETSYFCTEPWIGMFSVTTNQDVEFCPCYLKTVIGNLNEQSMHEVWNAPLLLQLRRSFQDGKLPAPCQGQLCPVALGEGPEWLDP